jgi:alpha-N-acetylglucosaminidase
MRRYVARSVGLVCLCGVVLGGAWAAAATPEEAARGLLERLLPAAADRFVLESIPAENGRDVFEIESRDGKVVVRGSTGVAIASGVNWYLKYYCHCQVSFCGDQLRLPDPLPAVEEKVRQVSPFPYRYCFNYCAFSYTLAFWDWAQWERMIDWMALHGVNMPLAVTGQEAIWYKVCRDLGLSDEEIGQFLVGPAYLPFGWMGCIDGWGGPLPHSWIASHRELEERILARERELGMTPVLQGFTGHVPAAMKAHFPHAKFRQLPSWCQFPGTTFLDPMDPMFERVGKALVEEQTRAFGTDHLYASDTFIEMSPPSNDPAFLDAMGRAVYGAMKAGDPEATWVMQGWIFVNNPRFWKPPQGKALLGAVPDERMILLDLHCESRPAWRETEAFYGKPWVFCIIQNFGGRVALYGGLRQISENLAAALESPERGRLSGLGLIMEGFGYNPIVYDFLTEMTWRTEVPGPEPWVRDFVRSRYGTANPQAEAAWKRLTKTAYSTPGYVGTVICSRPELGLNAPSSPYPEELAQAWQELLGAADELGEVDTYRFDVVHLARQVVGDVAGTLYGDVVDAYQRKDREALAAAGERFLESIRDVDRLLATRREFLLGKWLADAKRWATNDEEWSLYEWNARNLITLWGPRDSILHEYAQRQWSGLIGDFYLPRWQLFIQRLDEALTADKPFDAAAFEQEIRTWEENWTHGSEPYPAEPHGDPVAVARELQTKYGRIATEQDAKSLTTGKPVTCSFALEPHPAALANDGRRRDTNRFWATDANVDREAWWQVDLEEPTTVGRVVVVFYYGDQRSYGFTVETSLDGKTWDTVADYRENLQQATRQGTTCTFPPRPVRYLRVTVTHNSANTGRHLVEVMAFEK